MNNPEMNRDKQIEQITKYISKMPSLSTTVTKVLKVCDSPTTSANDLNRVVSLDPVLTGNVLKLINSAFYATKGQITSLTKAIIMLGLNTIKNLALSTAILGGLGGKKSPNPILDAFWAHSIYTGVAAKSIASITGVNLMDREEYFVAGLMHDLGKIPLINCFPQEYGHVFEITRQKKVPFIQAEKHILGMHHITTGKLIAEKWKLSSTIYDAICSHHDPDSADDESQRVILVTALADTYAKILETGTQENITPEEDPILIELLEKVDISWSALSEISETIFSEIENAKVFLQIV